MFENNEKIKNGDLVVVTDNGDAYTTYASWVALNVGDKERIARYCFDRGPKNGQLGRVFCIAPHDLIDRLLAYVRTSDGYYLIGLDGLMKVNGEDFLDIEKYLGE